jgi:hypothetical protein
MYLFIPIAVIASLASAMPHFFLPLIAIPYAPAKVLEFKDHPQSFTKASIEVSVDSNSNKTNLKARDDPPRGCGTAIDNVRNGETLVGDGECHYMRFDIDRMHVGAGCDCVTFESSKCGASEPKYWSSWIRGPSTIGKLPTWGSHWYACSDDRAFGKVCKLLR